MNSKISITTQTYFGDHFYYTGWVAVLLGIPIMIVSWWYAGLIILLMGILVTTSRYKLEIDINARHIEDYLFILWMKKDRVSKSYGQLSRIYVKSEKYTQQLQLRAASTLIEGTMYYAFLATDVENLYLGESKSKKKIERKARKIADKLGVDMITSPN